MLQSKFDKKIVLEKIFDAMMAAKRLYHIKADHELLSYLSSLHDDSKWQEFIVRFGKPGLTKKQRKTYAAMAYIWGNYAITLSEACHNPKKPIVVRHPAAMVNRALH